MNATHFAHLVRAELVKLLSRGSARAGLVVSGLIGLAMPFIALAVRYGMWQVQINLAQESGAPTPPIPDLPIDTALAWALNLRNFFILPAFVILVVTVSFAGEFQARTLREDLLRPVPRWSVLAAKWSATALWIGATLLLPWLLSGLLGVAIFRGEGDLAQVTLGYLASGLSDVALGTLVLAIAVLTRSVAGTIVGVFLFYVLSYAALFAMYVSRVVPVVPRTVVDVVDVLLPWMPSAALSVWTGYRESAPWSVEGFAGLAIMLAVSAAVAVARFERVDVP